MNCHQRFTAHPETGPPGFFPNCAEPRAIREVFDYPPLVLRGMWGNAEARRYIVNELEILAQEGNINVLSLLARHGLKEANALLAKI